MSRALATSLALALATAFAVPAFADTARTPAAVHEDRGGERAEKRFPMPADQFKAHVAKREEKIRAHVEKRIEKKQLPADEADKLRGEVNDKISRLNVKVDEVCADGTVTKDEAKQVWALSKELFPHKKHHKEGQPTRR